MKKEEFIKRRGKAAWKKHLAQSSVWKAAHPKEVKAAAARWKAANQEKVKASHQEQSRKGGKYYDYWREHFMNGLLHERILVRMRHRKQYHGIKEATPNTEFHHEWIPGTAKYRGLALVDKEMHRRGIIKVIKLLEGQITLFTEKEVKKEEK